MAKLNAVTRELNIDETVYDLDTDEGLAALREYVVSDGAEVVVSGMPVYNSGWNRNDVAVHPDFLAAYVETMPNEIVIEGHDPTRKLGRGGQARLVEDERGSVIEQDLHITTPAALADLAIGANLRASIAFSTTERSQHICSLCGGEWLEGDCDHWRGDMSEDGKGWQLLITHPVHRETSITHQPACTRTGSDFRFSSTDLIGLAERVSVKRGEKLARLESEREGLAQELADTKAKLDQAQALVDEMRHREASKTVRDIRRRKALHTPAGMTGEEFEALLIKQYLADPAGFSLLIGSAPDSPLNKVTAPVESIAPEMESPTPPQGTQAYAKWRLSQAEKLAQLKGIPIAEAIKSIK